MNAQYHSRLRWNPWLLAMLVACSAALAMGMVSRADAQEARPAEANQEAMVVSPGEGFFLVSECPGGEPLVEPGDVVHEKTVVGYVESLERTPVEAGVYGVVVEVMFADMSPVAKGDPLFRVELLN